MMVIPFLLILLMVSLICLMAGTIIIFVYINLHHRKVLDVIQHQKETADLNEQFHSLVSKLS